MSNITMNRLENTQNSHQGNFKKVLAVCSAGLLRSPTLAWVLSNPPYNCNTRAAGSVPSYALVHADAALLFWADVIIYVGQENADDTKNYLDRLLKQPDVTDLIKFTVAAIRQKKTYVLNVPDQYRTRSPELIKALEVELARIEFQGATA